MSGYILHRRDRKVLGKRTSDSQHVILPSVQFGMTFSELKFVSMETACHSSFLYISWGNFSPSLYVGQWLTPLCWRRLLPFQSFPRANWPRGAQVRLLMILLFLVTCSFSVPAFGAVTFLHFRKYVPLSTHLQKKPERTLTSPPTHIH